MREKRTVQASIFEAYAKHEIGRELKAMSDWLDENTDLLDWVAAGFVIYLNKQKGTALVLSSLMRLML